MRIDLLALWAILNLVIWGYFLHLLPLALILTFPLLLALKEKPILKVTEKQFQSLCDFTLIALVVGYVLIVTQSDRKYDGLRTTLRYLPLFFYLLMALRCIAQHRDSRLSSLFILTRYPTLGFHRFAHAKVDVAHLFGLFCLFGASCPEDGLEDHFYPIAAGSVALALVFSSRARAAWPWRVFAASLALVMGFFLQQGVQRAEAYLLKNASPWWAQGLQKASLQQATALGQTANLQMDDSIHLRLQTRPGDPKDLYLKSASFEFLIGGDTWGTGRPVRQIGISPSGHLAVRDGHGVAPPEGADERELWLHMGDEAWIPLPPDTPSLRAPGVDAADRIGLDQIRIRSQHDLVHLHLHPPHEQQEALVGEEVYLHLDLKAWEQQLMEEFLLRPAPNSSLHWTAWLRDHFQGFEYALDLQAPHQGPKALKHFLKETREGHCEYFATTSVLLLRYAGIPARYCTGYLLGEKDQGWWLGRGLNAHAWAEAWDATQQRWVVMEATPPTILPTGSWLGFRSTLEAWIFSFEQWRYADGEDRMARYAPWLLLVVLCYFGVRLFREWRAHRSSESQQRLQKHQLSDPGFKDLEKSLSRKGLGRQPQETYDEWHRRRGDDALEPHIIELWDRWAYDPHYESNEDDHAVVKASRQRWRKKSD